jgi:hypothetical protein
VAAKKINKDAIPVRTYQELHQYVRAFSAGHLNLLIILGGPGLAKNQTVRQSVAANAGWLEGNATAFGIYNRLYHHRNAPVVIDDVDSLYTDKAAVRLRKCLCQTDKFKNVA